LSVSAVILDARGLPIDRACIAQMLDAIPLDFMVDKAIETDISIGIGIGSSGANFDGIVQNERATAAFAGRIHNRDDVAATLGMRQRSVDDAALLLAAHDRWGADCLPRLDGDFTAIIWDRRAQRLIAARDALGVQPLYYHQSQHALYLASHPAAIIAVCPAAGEAQDAAVLASYAAGHAHGIDRTLYPAIFRLPPGHRLRATAVGIDIARYFSWPSATRPAGREAPERFAELLDRGVRRRMVGPAPVASLLSGGLDSSSVVAMAQRQAQRLGQGPLRTYSQIYPDAAEGDESLFIRAMVDEGGLNPHFLDCTEVGTFDGLDAALAVQAGPFIGPNLATTTYTFRKVAEAGFPVLLDGHGGDESTYSGVASLFDLAYSFRWLALWREVRAIARLDGLNAAQLMINLLRKRGPHSARTQRNRAMSTPPRPIWLGPTVPWPADGAQLPQPGRDTQAEHLAALTNPFFVQALELLAHASASQGIELRFPLLDRDLIAWCLTAPIEEKLADGYTRALLRKGMAGYLPDQVRCRRDKHDFTAHVIRGMGKGQPGMIADLLADRHGRLSPYFDMGVVRAQWHSLQEGSTVVDGFTVQAIWRAVVLGRWLQLHG
jgi:asparagine synthase (glutamine-hydrolysing)